MAAIALLALGYLLGRGPILGKGTTWAAKLAHAETKTIVQPAVATVLALMAVLLGAWCLRRLWLEYLASWPAAIQVPDFACPPGVGCPSVAHLTAQFRNRLATLRLQSTSAAPGPALPSNFLDVLNEDPASGSLGAIAKLLGATFPSTALVVRGTLLQRDEPSSIRFGISLQLTRMPDQGSRLEDIWDTSWERVMRRAADSAIAAILPRTRLCRGPWASWRGYVMPAKLLSAYEEASALNSERRYCAALESCYRALECDPFNRAVRLQLGRIQEQLGLFLDALATYHGILTSAKPAGHRLPRRLYRRGARRERARMAHIARYRLIVLLGGPAIVRQWEHVGEDDRAQEIEEMLARICKRKGVSGDPVRSLLDNLRQATPTGAQATPTGAQVARRLLSIELAHSARVWADGLRRTLRWWRLLHPLAKPHLLPTTVTVTRACIKEELAILEHHTDLWGGDRRLKVMDDRVNKCERWVPLRSWQSHYNAACLYAIPLLHPELSGDARAPQFARRAIDHLELGASFADSAFLASRRDWLLCEDPDLIGLRRRREFERFVANYFPTAVPAAVRPQRADELVLACYTRELVCDIATGWRKAWDLRSQTVDPGHNPRLVWQWWRQEVDTWKLIENLAAGAHGWRTYVSLDLHAHIKAITAQHAWRLTSGVEVSGTRFPRYEEMPLVDRQASAEDEIEWVQARLRSLHAILGHHAPYPAPEQLDMLGMSSPSSRQAIRQICQARAMLWGSIHGWFDAQSSLSSGEDAFVERVRQAVQDVRAREAW